MTHYIIKNPTVGGEPAGPELENYLSFSEDDVVVVVREGALFGFDDPDKVVINFPDADDCSGEQEIDRSSLVEIIETEGRLMFNTWEEVPVGVVVIDHDKSLVWVKQSNGDAVANAVENDVAGGWLNFGDEPPSHGAYPMRRLHQ